MAISYQISCINKTDRSSAHERIHSVGGVHDGTRWKLTQEAAIAGIENGSWLFYVNRDGYRADVIVSKSALGHKYLKTVADGVQPDNLLSLPECP